jgi:hypothetical protein
MKARFSVSGLRSCGREQIHTNGYARRLQRLHDNSRGGRNNRLEGIGQDNGMHFLHSSVETAVELHGYMIMILRGQISESLHTVFSLS